MSGRRIVVDQWWEMALFLFVCGLYAQAVWWLVLRMLRAIAWLFGYLTPGRPARPCAPDGEGGA